MRDETEDTRRAMVAEINSEAGDRAALEAQYGQVWDSDELRRDFAVEGFMAPFVVARRKADDVRGSLMFTHSPRFYFSWTEDSR